MALEFSLFLFTSAPREVFLALFVFWRLAYNFGLGVLLHVQSKDRTLVRIAKKAGLGPGDAAKRGWFAKYLVAQVEKKMSDEGRTYDYESMPLEFNTWIFYRGLVDIILVNDFTCYFLFSVAYFQAPAGGHGFTDVLRYIGGFLMLVFNLWVKTDAHRVVKDFAWYWGDFFFLVDASLIFDGVFELAPHPMYSVGYIGFYGTALIAQSYWVLFISLAAHASQMAFLHWVENPHIDKTYNRPRGGDGDKKDRAPIEKYFHMDLLVFRNLDWFRSTDLQTVLIVGYTVLVAFLIGPIPEDKHWNSWKFWFFIGQAFFWRVFHTYGLGLVLYLQSNFKFWNRHFIKYGESLREGFQHWKVIYNTSQIMTYVSFLICAWKLYTLPETWITSPALLLHTLGALFIILHIWVAVSIYEVIGSLGWFYGDFFIDALRYRNGPIYTGIYRYLDNPLLYTFSCWGIALITRSPALYVLTFFGQISNYLFLHYVERPHMQALYGEKIRTEAGVERVLKSKVGELEKAGTAVVEKLAKDLDLVEVLERVRALRRTGQSELKRVLGRGAGGRRSKSGASPASAIDSPLPVTPSASDTEWRSGTEADEDSSSASEMPGPDDGPEGLRRRRRSREGALAAAGAGAGAGSGRIKEDGNVAHAIAKVIGDLEDMVDRAGRGVARLATAAGLEEFEPATRHLPTSLYSVALTTISPSTPATFPLGAPIPLSFSAPLGTLTPKDWIGIYPVAQNPRPDVTTTKSHGKWLYVTARGPNDSSDIPSPTTPAAIATLIVESNPTAAVGSSGEAMTGKLVFTGARLPWKAGTYEARYHRDGKYGVVTVSRPFEIVAEPVVGDDAADVGEPGPALEALRAVVERCVDLNVGAGDRPLDVHEHCLERVPPGDECLDVASFEKYKEEVSRRIVYAIKHMFGIEFSWKVVALVRSVDRLARR
ncbi:phospholipid methyltransferase-domain-containing protein, partial [Blyttiomyces helicus]